VVVWVEGGETEKVLADRRPSRSRAKRFIFASSVREQAMVRSGAFAELHELVRAVVACSRG
jgi:hypothetical protein